MRAYREGLPVSVCVILSRLVLRVGGCDLNVCVPDHCLSVYFAEQKLLKCSVQCFNGSCSSVLAFVVTILSDEPQQKQWRGLVDRKLVKSPSNFIAGRPKAVLLFCFFSDLRCGVPLFIVILVI